MRSRTLPALLALLLLLPAGCQKAPEPTELTTFAMDTMMSFTLYGEEAQTDAVLAWIPTQLGALEAELSATREDSDIFRIDRAEGQPVEVRACVSELLSDTLELCRITDGALDITAYPAVKAWGFTTGEHRVPDEEELAELAAKIDYTAVGWDGPAVTLPAGMELDVGAVAKGYAGDVLAETARANGISSALLDLGQSTIVAIGTKPGGKPWRIGIRDPAGESYLAVVELMDMSLGTSGGYQRYFEEDGEVYWHILDPDTAAPARSGLASVTVVAPSALLCDGLSTALFVMGLEEGSQFWRDHPELEFDALFITEEGQILCTAGLEGRASLAEGYEDREVTVLR